jgi:hypothetical protein
MLRAIVVALLVANLGYYAWTQGALAVFGTQPERFNQTEPQRLQQQVRPELLQIVRVAPAAAAGR